jgi:hypothetical protein
MPADRFQNQRFELKYLVSEETARAVRQFIRCYLKPDEFAAALPGFAYPVHSLYLDSPDLATYQAVQSGEKNRFKLRIRYYSDTDKAVHFEIKRRTNDIISKSRASVHREFVQPLLAGVPPQLKHLVKPGGKQLAALQEFCRLMHKLRAAPKSHVAYTREAWMSPVNNSMRVTFDRAVQCEPEFSTALTTALGESVQPFDEKVVLELKFVDRLPSWCLEMIRVFGLVRGGAPKYAKGVYLLGEHRVSNRGIGLKVVRPAATAPISAPIPFPAPIAVAVA